MRLKRSPTDAQRIPVVALCDHLDGVGDRIAADAAVAAILRTTIGSHRLREIVIARKGAEAQPLLADQVKAEIDRAIGEIAVTLLADGRRIQRSEGREILILQFAAREHARAEIALKIETAGVIDAAEAFARVSAHAAIGQPRHHRAARNVVEIFRGLVRRIDVAQAELAEYRRRLLEFAPALGDWRAHWRRSGDQFRRRCRRRHGRYLRRIVASGTRNVRPFRLIQIWPSRPLVIAGFRDRGEAEHPRDRNCRRGHCFVARHDHPPCACKI